MEFLGYNNTLGFEIGVVSIVLSEHEVLLQHSFSPVLSMKELNVIRSSEFVAQPTSRFAAFVRVLSAAGNDKIEKKKKKKKQRGTDRGDAVGAIHVDGVLLQVRLDLRQRPRPGPHHHRAAPCMPAATVQQLLLWPHRRLHPQLLRRSVMAVASSAGRCRW